MNRNSGGGFRSWVGLRTRLHKLRYPMPKHVMDLYTTYRNHPDSLHIIGERDAAVIYNLVRRNRPSHCWELGGGLGTVTAIIATAMRENSYGSVTS